MDEWSYNLQWIIRLIRNEYIGIIRRENQGLSCIYTSHCNQPLYNMLNDYEFKEQEEED